MIEQQTGEQITRSARGDHDQCPCGGIETTSLSTPLTMYANLETWLKPVNPVITRNKSESHLLTRLIEEFNVVPANLLTLPQPHTIDR